MQAIQVAGVGKKYRIGPRQRYKALRDTLTDALSLPARTIRAALRGPHARDGQARETIWALRNVSFEVNRGEVVGIIGGNGAGKSTLLKVLARITEPSEGVVDVWGRVGSLLEVGTGFNPEVSGRDNVFLNGAILGMRRSEITRKFDEIVAFAEIERFLDTPVKRYSTGMYMRLAFSVAAHLEPEILLVDEVLAVGDAAFQRKCLGKIDDVAKHGRTVFFVSHNLAAIQTLCTRVLRLESGQLLDDGATRPIIESYLHSESITSQQHTSDLSRRQRSSGSGSIQITRATTCSDRGIPRTSFAMWEPFVIDVLACATNQTERASFWLFIRSSSGPIVLSSFMYDVRGPVVLTQDSSSVRVSLDPNPLVPGQYKVSLGAFDGGMEMAEWVDDCLDLEIRSELSTGHSFDGRLGLTTHRYQWKSSESI